MNKSPYQNSERARCPRFGAAARREEGEYPLWIFDRRATPQQRQRLGNAPIPYFVMGSKLFFRNALRLILLVASLRALTASAQMPDAAGGVNSAMIKLFGDNISFTARA